MNRWMARPADDYPLVMLPTGRVLYASEIPSWRVHLFVGVLTVLLVVGVGFLEQFLG